MDIIIWITQILLAIIFFMAGLVKIVLPINKLENKIGKWVNDFSSLQIKSIGSIEMLGAMGLILPMWLEIYPILTPIAAAGLSVTMLGAIKANAKVMKKNPDIKVNVILFILAIIIVIGRLYLVPVPGIIN